LVHELVQLAQESAQPSHARRTEAA